MSMLDSNVRHDVEETLRREDPRRLGAHALVRVVVQAGVPCREVPQARVHAATDLEGHTQAAVECRCGYRPLVDLGAPPVKCECARWFFYSGTTVFALAGPVAS